MHKAQHQVDAFHRACGLRRPGYDVANIDWAEAAGIRLSLITEEVKELEDAIEQQDPIETVDALCDILYVVYGFAVAFGINLEDFFTEVHRANMQKTLGPKREDGKQLKPEGWQPPDHKRVWEQIYGTD